MDIVVASPVGLSDEVIAFTGTIASANAGSGTVSGSIDVRPNVSEPTLSPSASFVFQYDVAPPQDAGNDVDHVCVAKIDGRGHLILTHIEGTTAGKVFVPEDFDLTPIGEDH